MVDAFQAPFRNNVLVDFLDAVPVLIAVHDTDHNIMWTNRADRERSGSSLQQIEGKGKKCCEIWGIDQTCRGCPVRLSVEDGEPHKAELTPENQDRWPLSQGAWLSRSAPLNDAAGRVVGSIEVAYDITKQKQAEAALAQLNAELETRVRQRTAE